MSEPGLGLDPCSHVVRCEQCQPWADALGQQLIDLTAQLAAVQKERDELRTMLDAWRSQFKTTQLTHAVAKMDALEARLATVTETLRGYGYHAPGECPHGMAHWIGDRCLFECATLEGTG